MIKLTELQKIKWQRKVNRSKNGLVEKLLKLIAKVQAQLEALDAEQDAIYTALQKEKTAIQERKNHHIAELKAEIDRAEKQAFADSISLEKTFTDIAKEVKDDADVVRKIATNLNALTK